MLLPRAIKARWEGVSTEFILALEEATMPFEKGRADMDGFRGPCLEEGILELNIPSRELVGRMTG